MRTKNNYEHTYHHNRCYYNDGYNNGNSLESDPEIPELFITIIAITPSTTTPAIRIIAQVGNLPFFTNTS